MAAFCTSKTKIDYSIGIISVFIYTFFIATAKSIDPLLFLPVIVQAFILKVDFKTVLKQLLKVNLFIGITFLILLLEGKDQLAWLVFVRANLILWFTLSFDFDGFKLYGGLQNLKVSNKLSLLLFFTVKYIDVLFESALRFKEVMKLRGFKPSFNKRTFKTYGDIFGFLLYTSVCKMEKVEDLITLRTKGGRLLPPKKIVAGYKDILLLSSVVGVIFVYYIK